jgi:hypothetical protein
MASQKQKIYTSILLEGYEKINQTACGNKEYVPMKEINLYKITFAYIYLYLL